MIDTLIDVAVVLAFGVSGTAFLLWLGRRYDDAQFDRIYGRGPDSPFSARKARR